MPNVMILPSFIPIQIVLVHKSAPKPSLTRSKFEQLYISSCLLLILNFVDMLKSTKYDTTPSGAPRRIDLHDQILGNPFLLISRVCQSYIGNFLQMDSNLVNNLNSMCHLILLVNMAIGINLLVQNSIKYLLELCQNHSYSDPNLRNSYIANWVLLIPNFVDIL